MKSSTKLSLLAGVSFFFFNFVSFCFANDATDATGATNPTGQTENMIDELVAGNVISGLLQPVADLFVGNAWLQGGAVMLATFLVASSLTWILFKLVSQLTRKTISSIDDRIAALAKPPVYYSFLVTGFITGLNLMPLSEKAVLLSGRCIRTLGLIIWIIFLIRLAHLVLTRMAQLADEKSFIQRQTVTLFDNGAKVIIFAIGIYLFFVIWKIDMTAWLASAGIVGIAVGFAAKDTLSNLFSGVFILADAPYKVGDYVVLDQGGRGQVKHIGLRSTRLLTRDDVEITVPNSIIGNTTIINQTGGPVEKMRLRVAVGVAYGSDIDVVQDILQNIAEEEKLVEKSPKPRVRFRVFGASSLDFELLCWVKEPVLRGMTLHKLNCAIYKEFNKQNIEIPFAKQDMYIKEWPERDDV